MAGETDQPAILDTVKASAAKFRETTAALESRGKELDALEARLVAERTGLAGQGTAFESERVAFRQEREAFASARSGLGKDAAALQAEREAVAADETRLVEWSGALQGREQELREAEDRLERRGVELTSRMDESRARLQVLLEREDLMGQREHEFEETVTRLTAMGRALEVRGQSLAEMEEEFIRRQNDRLAALSSQENELTAFCDAIRDMEAEAGRQSESYGALKAALGADLDSLVVARGSLVEEKERLLEADAILADAAQSQGADSEGPRASTDGTSGSEPIGGNAPENAAIPAETLSARVTLVADDDAEPEAESPTTRDLAVVRLAQAIAAWERARAAGWNVSDLRGPAKSARSALASGDYQGAVRLASTILDRLHTTTGAA